MRHTLLNATISQEQAKVLYFKLWTLHIDSRALLQRGDVKTEGTNVVERPRKWKVKPGGFFKTEEGEVVMVMGQEKEGKWNCVSVREGDEGKYELFVAEQTVLRSTELVEEFGLEYHTGTRYYVVKEEWVKVDG